MEKKLKGLVVFWPCHFVPINQARIIKFVCVDFRGLLFKLNLA